MEPKQQILIDYLEQKSVAIKEYELMTDLQKNTRFFSELGERSSLFKKHFYLFHHLYLLAEALKEQCFELEISALSIKLRKVPLKLDQEKDNHVSGYKAEIIELRKFYLNKEHLDLPENEIQDMLALFWEKYLALDNKSDAIKCLGLENCKELSRSQIKKRYNQLASQYHPDKGGDPLKFMRIKESYEQLMIVF